MVHIKRVKKESKNIKFSQTEIIYLKSKKQNFPLLSIVKWFVKYNPLVPLFFFLFQWS